MITNLINQVLQDFNPAEWELRAIVKCYKGEETIVPEIANQILKECEKIIGKFRTEVEKFDLETVTWDIWVKRIESECNGDENVGKNGSFHLQFVEMRVMAQWPIVCTPKQGSYVQIHLLACGMSQSFIPLRSTKWVTGAPGDSFVKSKVFSSSCSFALKWWNSVHRKGPWKGVCIKDRLKEDGEFKCLTWHHFSLVLWDCLL